MRTGALTRVVAFAAPVLGMLAAGCAGSTHTHASSVQQSRAGSAEEVSFLRKCSESVGAGGLGDAAVCQCMVTQLQAHDNAHTFKADAAWWENHSGGAGRKSTIGRTIARCDGQPEIRSLEQPMPASASATVSAAHTIKLSNQQ